MLFEASSQNVTANSGIIGKLLHGHAGIVTVDQIVKIRYFNWSNHVYDLQSSYGLIIAQGIIVSNCRCTMEGVIEGDEEVLTDEEKKAELIAAAKGEE